MAEELHNVTLVVLLCITFVKIIRIPYCANYQGLPDEGDNDYRRMQGAWRQEQVLPDLGGPEQGNNVTVPAKRQTLLKTLQS